MSSLEDVCFGEGQTIYTFEAYLEVPLHVKITVDVLADSEDVARLTVNDSCFSVQRFDDFQSLLNPEWLTLQSGFEENGSIDSFHKRNRWINENVHELDRDHVMIHGEHETNAKITDVESGVCEWWPCGTYHHENLTELKEKRVRNAEGEFVTCE